MKGNAMKTDMKGQKISCLGISILMIVSRYVIAVLQ